MPPRRQALEVVRAGNHQHDSQSQKWQVPLTEGAFETFIGLNAGDGAARRVFGEGSVFSPFLFGKFFDPADAFPLWDFDSEVLLAGNPTGSVVWQETAAEYVFRAQLPGASKCEVEINGDKGKVVEITGQWRRSRESETKEWKAGRWWEHGYVRRIELPEDANWRKIEAYAVQHDDDHGRDDDSDGTFLEIKIPKDISGSNALHSN